jgi:hypothetical protein
LHKKSHLRVAFFMSVFLSTAHMTMAPPLAPYWGKRDLLAIA